MTRFVQQQNFQQLKWYKAPIFNAIYPILFSSNEKGDICLHNFHNSLKYVQSSMVKVFIITIPLLEKNLKVVLK